MNAIVSSPVNDLLRAWLPEQRWYGGKGQPIDEVSILSTRSLVRGEASEVSHVLLAVRSDNATSCYQLLLGSSTGEPTGRTAQAIIGEADGTTFYDAVHDEAAASALLEHLVRADEVEGLRFRHTHDQLEGGRRSRVMSAEQSNTSIVYDEHYILKLFRRVQPGLNPDLEITQALAEQGSPHIASPLGWMSGDVDGVETTLGMLQCFLRGSSDGWSMATTSVRDLFAEADLHADEVGGDFAGEAERLGAATAEVHALLARALPSALAGPEQSQATARQLHTRLDAALAAVPELAPHESALRRAYDAVGELTEPVPVQRVHGDFHLGQVLRTQDGWVLLDFEGEPARSLDERTALMSPLRDVAGMLRSFDYAARHLLAEHSGEQHLAYRATEWAEHNRAAFCAGYASASGTDPQEQKVLLTAFELDKAVYEVLYEARNRPAWIGIPLGSIERLAAGLQT